MNMGWGIGGREGSLQKKQGSWCGLVAAFREDVPTLPDPGEETAMDARRDMGNKVVSSQAAGNEQSAKRTLLTWLVCVLSW